MTQIPLDKNDSKMNQIINEFKDYYRTRYPLSKGQTLPIILYHVVRGVLFIATCIIVSSLMSGLEMENRIRSFVILGIVLAVFWVINYFYAKIVKSWLGKRGYLEEPGIVLGYLESIANELNMGDGPMVLLKEEEYDKDREVVMELKHIQIPFDAPMVVLPQNGTGNKFYLSSDGPELIVDAVKG